MVARTSLARGTVGGAVRFRTRALDKGNPGRKLMTLYDTSSTSDMAYAISRKRYLASAMLIVGSVSTSAFIVTYCLVSAFGHTGHVSTTVSFLLSFAVGGISSGLYLIDDRESWNRTS